MLNENLEHEAEIKEDGTRIEKFEEGSSAYQRRKGSNPVIGAFFARSCYCPNSRNNVQPEKDNLMASTKNTPMRTPRLSLVSRLLAPTLAATFLLSACGSPKAVRGEDVAGLDDQAMGTGLDKRDLKKLLADNMDAMNNSAVVKRWEGQDSPTLAVMPFRNETSEHIESALDALISDVETALVNAGHVTVVSLDQQPAMMAQIKAQQGDSFDQGQSAEWGRQLGVKYIITGKVFTTDEKFDNERRVQYYMFMQVLEVETGAIRFQNKSELTKAII
ncbi:MAG: penicillin-binding protein activator LpoB [Polyangiaceae bacterium]|nr:penicillin-binding protein activator LpoB [Polyangiaceae bacterium]